MADDVTSISAAVLAAEFIRRDELNDVDAIRLWHRLQRRMEKLLAKDAARAEPEETRPAAQSVARPRRPLLGTAKHAGRTAAIASAL